MQFIETNPVLKDAVQWFKNGDHDLVENIKVSEAAASFFDFDFASGDGAKQCRSCRSRMDAHGVFTPYGGEPVYVCPGSWIFDNQRVWDVWGFAKQHKPEKGTWLTVKGPRINIGLLGVDNLMYVVDNEPDERPVLTAQLEEKVRRDWAKLGPSCCHRAKGSQIHMTVDVAGLEVTQ